MICYWLGDDSNELKDHLMERLDYTLLPEEGWKILYEHYGSLDNQEPITRKVGWIKGCAALRVKLLPLCLISNCEWLFIRCEYKIESMSLKRNKTLTCLH